MPVDKVDATSGFSTLDGKKLSISDMRDWVTEAKNGPFIPWDKVKKELLREISELKNGAGVQKL